MKCYSDIHLSTIPDGVFFDLDNTLFDYNKPHSRALDHALGLLGERLNLSKELMHQVFDEARREVKRRAAKTAASHNRLLYFHEVLQMHGLGSHLMLALELEQAYWREFMVHMELFPDALGLIDDLRMMGVRVALVTDQTTAIQFRKLVFLDLANLVDVVVTSEEAGHDKPHQDPFLLARKRLNPPGSQIWMIGDDYEADMVGAKQAIQAITFLRVSERLEDYRGRDAADFVFTQFRDLRRLLSSLAS